MKTRPQRRSVPFLRITGDNRLRQFSKAIENVVTRLDDFGLIATPDMSWREIMAHCGTVSGAGSLNIMFSEGTWTFKNGVVLNRPRVHLWAQGGNTVFERHQADADVTERVLLTIKARNVTINGIRFNESQSTSSAAVKAEGSECVVSRCIFDDCFRAIEVDDGAVGVRLLDNYVRSARDTVHAIRVLGAATDGVISGNVIASTHTKDIKLENATLRYAIVGNNTFNGTIEYRGADGHAAAGNPGTVTVL